MNLLTTFPAFTIFSMTNSLMLKPNGRSFWAIIPAGGTGSRFSLHQNKLLAFLDEKPVIWHSVQAFLNHPWIEGVIVMASEQNLTDYQSYFENNSRLKWAIGGINRRETVCNGLNLLPSEVSHVVIHDAARPLVSAELIETVILAACEESCVGAIAAIPVSDTLKKSNLGNSLIEQTVDRQNMWGAQTPQVFQTHTLKKAHQLVPLNAMITDDAQLIELTHLGQVQLCASLSNNLKITTEADLRLAQALKQLK
jgi:2-C-methyl-D-erythritol 4-phosphate cytidylyltransferase